jgi:sugar O-acyltransferase (sialic acid O-acetyltransferase NeuD family)
MNNLILLGFSERAISIVTQVAYDALGISKFDTVSNIDFNEAELPFEAESISIHKYRSVEYDFSTNRNIKVQFGVGTVEVKYLVFKWFLKNFGIDQDRYVNLIHPKSYFPTSAYCKSGFLLEPLSGVSAFAKIGFGVTVRRNASVGHHSILEDFVNVNPGATISGNVVIGKGTTIGAGAVVIDHINIGSNCLIGAGSVVTRDIPSDTIAYGNPCKVIRQNNQTKI